MMYVQQKVLPSNGCKKFVLAGVGYAKKLIS